MSRLFMNADQRLLAVAAAAALLAAGPVFGAPVTFGNFTLDATYALGGGPVIDGMTSPGASLVNFGNGGNYYLESSSGNNSVFFHTYGSGSDANTYFGARASGQGYLDAYTRSSFSGRFVATVANPTFSFYVDSGQIGLTGKGTGRADLKLEVRLNNTAIARDHTTITLNGAASACSDNGDGLGALANYIKCSASDSSSEQSNGQLFSADLSGLAAGEAFTLDYDIIATISGNLVNGTTTHYVCDGGYGGYGGYGGGNCHLETVSNPGIAIARSGDPFSISNTTDAPGNLGALSLDGATAVPEPDSLALVALALVGGAAVRRKRKQVGI